MAASGSYLKPVNSQGYHRCSIFGNFKPKNTRFLKNKLLVQHRRSVTEGSYDTNLRLLTSGKYARSRRLAKSLPSLNVKQLVHSKNDKEKFKADGDNQRWWEIPNHAEYKVKPTRFRKEEINYNEYRHYPNNNSNKIQSTQTNLTNSHGYLSIDLQYEPKFPSKISGIFKNPYQRHVERYTHLYSNLSKPATASTWSYSRSRSGLRKWLQKPPTLKQVFIADFVPSSHIPKEASNPRPSNLQPAKHHIKAIDITKGTDDSLKNSQDIRKSRANGRVPLPEISIEGNAVPMPTKKHEPEIATHLELLKLTSEWMKILQAEQNYKQPPSPKKQSKVAIVNLTLNTSAALSRSESTNDELLDDLKCESPLATNKNAYSNSISSVPPLSSHLVSSTDQLENNTPNLTAAVVNLQLNAPMIVPPPQKLINEEPLRAQSYNDASNVIPSVPPLSTCLISFDPESSLPPSSLDQATLALPPSLSNQTPSEPPLLLDQSPSEPPQSLNQEPSVPPPSTYLMSLDQGQVSAPKLMARTKEGLPKWRPFFRDKPSANFERPKPINRHPYPHLLVFGHQMNYLLHSGMGTSEDYRRQLKYLLDSGIGMSEDFRRKLKHLLESGMGTSEDFHFQLKNLLDSEMEMSEESKKRLQAIAEFAINEKMNSGDINDVEAILWELQSAMRLNSPTSHQYNSPGSWNIADKVRFYADILRKRGVTGHESSEIPFGLIKHLLELDPLNHSYDGNRIIDGLFREDGTFDFSTLSARDIDAIRNAQLEWNGYHPNKSMGQLRGDRKQRTSQQRKQLAIDRKKQAEFSKLENDIFSVREDLEHVKEGKFMKPGTKHEREYIVPPSDSQQKNSRERKESRKYPKHKKRTKRNKHGDDNQLSPVSEESDYSETSLSSDSEGSMESWDSSGSGTTLDSVDDMESLDSAGNRIYSDSAESMESLDSAGNRKKKSRRKFRSRKSRSNKKSTSTAVSKKQSTRSKRKLDRMESSTSGMDGREVAGSNNPQRQAKVVLECLNELNDIRSMTEGILKSINPPEMNVSRPSTGEALGSAGQRSRLQAKERANEAGRLSILVEKDSLGLGVRPPFTQSGDWSYPTTSGDWSHPAMSGDWSHLTEEERIIEKERLAVEKVERFRRMQDELEQSLDTSDAVRLRRKQQAEGLRLIEEAERERQLLFNQQRAQEEQKLNIERARHAVLLEKLKKEADHRHKQQLLYGGILDEHNRTVQIWNDADFHYLSHYLGDEYSKAIRQKEEEKIRMRKQKMEAYVREALDFQRRELMHKLAIAQRNFMSGLVNEIEDLEHLLCISRAFIYSYFNEVADQTYTVPDELLLTYKAR